MLPVSLKVLSSGEDFGGGKGARITLDLLSCLPLPDCSAVIM